MVLTNRSHLRLTAKSVDLDIYQKKKQHIYRFTGAVKFNGRWSHLVNLNFNSFALTFQISFIIVAHIFSIYWFSVDFVRHNDKAKTVAWMHFETLMEK